MSAEAKGSIRSTSDVTRPRTPERSEGPDRVRPTARGNGNGSGRTVPDLIRELSAEGADLVRQELALAKVEMSEKADLFQRNLVSIALGGAFLLAALLILLWAVNSGLTSLLAGFVALDVAVWLSPLILAVVLGLVGWGMISKGKKGIKREGLAPSRTTETIREDTRWVRRKVRALKEEVDNG